MPSPGIPLNWDLLSYKYHANREVDCRVEFIILHLATIKYITNYDTYRVFIEFLSEDVVLYKLPY